MQCNLLQMSIASSIANSIPNATVTLSLVLTPHYQPLGETITT